MSLLKKGLRQAVAATLLTLALGGIALADDTEIYIGQPSSVAKPNILFVFDTSGSMGTDVITTVPFDPLVNYSGISSSSTCDPTRIYYSTNGTPPACNNGRYFNVTDFKCAAALGALLTNGQYIDYLIRWTRSGNNKFTYAWSATLTSGSTKFQVECQADNGVQGDTGNVTDTRPRADSTSSSTAAWLATSATTNIYWTTTGTTKTSYTLYSANYLNYYNDPARTTTLGTRMDIAKQSINSLLSSLSNVNVGLVRYNNNGGTGDAQAQGGHVKYAVSAIEPNRAALTSTVNAFTPAGFTPLSETLYESYLYFAGGAVDYGNTWSGNKSVAASRIGGSSTSNQYKSPIEYACQKNYIVYLTDGLPTMDGPAVETKITGLPGFGTLGGSCLATDPNPFDGTNSVGSGRCLGALAQYMHKADLNTTMNGQQNVTSYFIGFGGDSELATAFSYLQDAGVKGGGRAYLAGDLAELNTVLTQIVTEILQTSTTFTSPTVSVNAFNRTQTLSDLYVSVFEPSLNTHWPGNVKKYRLVNGVVSDSLGAPAVDSSTGFFTGGSRSYWSAATDGYDVTLGGAANRIPDPAARNLYTYLGADPARTTPPSPVDLTVGTNNLVSTTNALLTDALLGIGNPGDPPRIDLLNWARGEDVLNEDGDPTTLVRHAMGDPVHGQPSAVIYGGTTSAPNIDDAVIYAATNDGYLHAIDVITGNELWSFIPQELLSDLATLYDNNPISTKHYALDGDIRVLKYDTNGDGIVDPSAQDRVYLYVGQGRGGSNYYAIDVTNKNRPKMLWTLNATDLPGIGQAWSTPILARVNANSANQNTQHLVLIFGGGYDPIEETPGYNAGSVIGNKLFMVDAVYGDLLWSAGQSGATLNLPRMDHSIPSRITVMDINNDGYQDRMYVGDMAGQLWRFDITNGNSPATLVAGGVIASLGAHDLASPTEATARRFYNAPDVSTVVFTDSGPVLNIGIGSGYRGHPLNANTQDRFYSVRDTFRPFAPMTQAEYDGFTVITDTDMVDITTTLTPTVPASSPGWKMLLNQPGTTWAGEKVLASSSTANNIITFSTYTPGTGAVANPCQVGVGQNKLYAVNMYTGAPIGDTNADGTVTIADRSTALVMSGIAPEAAFLFLAPPTATPVGSSSSSGASSGASGSSGSSSGSTSSGASGSSGSGSSGAGTSSGSGGGSSGGGSSGGSSGGIGGPTIGGQQGVYCMIANVLVGPPFCPTMDRRNKTIWRESDAN